MSSSNDDVTTVQILHHYHPNLTYYSPVHKAKDDSRRLSQEPRCVQESLKLMQSTRSTNSAPVYRAQDSLISDQDDSPVIYFRIKSYVHSHCLRDKTTKSLYFLQLLRNVLDYKLICVDEIYLQLGSYAIQAFYGDYNVILTTAIEDRHSVNSSNTDSSDMSHPQSMARLSRISTLTFNFTPEQVESGKYFEPKKFFPSWIIAKYTPEYLFKEIPLLHRGLSGMSRVESEFSYIRMASAQYSNFNMHLFPVRDQKLSGAGSTLTMSSSAANNGTLNGVRNAKNKLWLGLSPSGLEMHQMKESGHIEHLSVLKWSDIDEVTRKSSRINIHVGCRSLKLHTNTKMQADHLFWLTRHMHMYQTKARLNATCTAEALESAERQKYREKYVYMDLEDLKLNGLHTPDIVAAPSSSETYFVNNSIVPPSVVRLPFVNTPAAPPRRTPSKAKPLKMKDLLRMANSSNDSTNASPVASFHIDKHPQYIKKSRHNSQTSNYAPIIHKGMRSPDTQIKIMNDSPYISLLFPNEIDKTESDQSTKVDDTLDDIDITCSINDSDPRSPVMPVVKPATAGRFVSLCGLLTQDNTDRSLSSIESPSSHLSTVLPAPSQFREPINSNIGKSTSFDISDIKERCPFKHCQPAQRHQSDPLISYVQLSRTVPLLIGLCHEFNNTQIIDDITSSKLAKINATPPTIGMKTWRSDVLFNLSTCLDNVEDHQDNDVFNNEIVSTNDHRTNHNNVHHYDYLDVVDLSSSSSSSSSLSSTHSNNNHDSVDISSISSFEINDIRYSRMSIGHSTQVTII